MQKIALIAAALLFYVSYWLHSKASLHAWKKYIDQQTTQALARGSMAGLALLAFLAVFREGAETAVFYLGMAPAIELRDLVLGIAGGALVLIVAAVLMLVVGVKLPLRPFFRVAGLLVYYLGFKFVGTGLHAKGWTEEQAVAYFVENSPTSEGQIRSEIRRYIVLPGQATAYKIGMLKILELRARAQAKLGSRFDIRAFHDTVLGGGALPLSILEQRVDDWIAASPGRAGGPPPAD